MVFRRLAAVTMFALVLSMFVILPSCTSAECEGNDRAPGCPCDDPRQCHLNSCEFAYCPGTCQVGILSEGYDCTRKDCTDPEGCDGVCDGSGPQSCVECLEDVHCKPGHTCEAGNVCSRCDDGILNGDEVITDCGGACPVCPGICNVDADCPDGGYCWDHRCASCNDGIKNGNEADVDCSMYGDGGKCPICYGYFCNEDSECKSGACETGSCCKTPCPVCYDCDWVTGECEPIGDGTWDDHVGGSPGETCYIPYQCNANAECLLMYGEPCTDGSQCVDYKCENGVCVW